MVRPAPVDYLQPDETSLVQTGRHGLSVTDELIVATILAAMPITGVLVLSIGYFPRLFMPVALPVLIVVGLAYLVFLLTRYWRVRTSVYIVTDERVYKSHGRLRFFGSQTTFDKLTDMHVKQSLFGRIWGFGTVRLETAGTGIALEGVRDPFGFKQQVEDARSAFIRTLVGEAPKTGKAREAEPRVPEASLWEGGIAGISLLGSIITAGIMLVVGFGALAMGVVVPPVLLVGGILLVTGALMLAGTLIRFRFTRFFVGTRGVVVTSGWLTRRRVETTYDKVTDVTVYQGILGRLLDFGTITVNTAGSNTAPVIFLGVHQPEQVKEIIDDARRAWESR